MLQDFNSGDRAISMMSCAALVRADLVGVDVQIVERWVVPVFVEGVPEKAPFSGCRSWRINFWAASRDSFISCIRRWMRLSSCAVTRTCMAQPKSCEQHLTAVSDDDSLPAPRRFIDHRLHQIQDISGLSLNRCSNQSGAFSRKPLSWPVCSPIRRASSSAWNRHRSPQLGRRPPAGQSPARRSRWYG